MSAHMKPTRKRAAPGRPALPDSERRDLKVQISLSGPEAAIFVARSRGGSLAATIRDHALAGVRAGVEIDAPRAGRAARDSALGEALRRVADAWPRCERCGHMHDQTRPAPSSFPECDATRPRVRRKCERKEETNPARGGAA